MTGEWKIPSICRRNGERRGELTMSIVEQEIAYVEEDRPSLDRQISVDWFSPRVLAALNAHPLDNTIRYTSDRTFYVTWFDSAADRPSVSETVSVTALVAASRHNPTIGTHATQDDDNDEDRREVGIRTHRWMECLLNGLPSVPGESAVHAQMHGYVNTLRTLPWRTEMPIRSCTSTCVVGVVDALFMVDACPEAEDVLVLDMVDWKYSVDVTSCLEEYELQLNMYKYILETHYGGVPFQVGDNRWCTAIRIRHMSLVMFHASYTTHKEHAVQDRQATVAAMFQARKTRLAPKDKCNT